MTDKIYEDSKNNKIADNKEKKAHGKVLVTRFDLEIKILKSFKKHINLI